MSKRLTLAGPLAAVLIAGGCGDIFLSISSDGRIEVFVSTYGGGFAFGGCTISVDGGVPHPVPSGGAVTLRGLQEGSHSVLLSSLAESCRVVGSNPRSVTVRADATASVGFEVRCGARSSSP